MMMTTAESDGSKALQKPNEAAGEDDPDTRENHFISWSIRFDPFEKTERLKLEAVPLPMEGAFLLFHTLLCCFALCSDRGQSDCV